MRVYHKRKLEKHDGERILWHVLAHLQRPPADVSGEMGRYLAILTIKQLLGISA
jgi:hypothetical protein